MTGIEEGRRGQGAPRWLFTLLGLWLLLLSSACGGSEATGLSARSPSAAPQPQMGSDGYGYSAEFAAPPPPPVPSDAVPGSTDELHVPEQQHEFEPEPTNAEGGEAGPSKTIPAPPAEKKAAPLLIYTALLTLAVFETEASIEAVEQLALTAGGYLVRRSLTEITVRVPAAKFREVLEAAADTGDELGRDVEALDVTDEYRDLTIRLRNAMALRDRLEKLLGAAKDVKEALAVEEQLERVTATIELYKGRLQRMRELITFSTLTVRYQARPVDEVSSRFRLPFPWLRRLGLPNLLEMEGAE